LEQQPVPGRSSAPGPLHGLRVVELGDEKGEYPALLLAGLGADVIKVEPPEGSPSREFGPFYEDTADPEGSLHFWVYNRGKKSVVLDLDAPDGMAGARDLVAGSDVIVDSTPRGWLAERGIVPAGFPALIHARLTAFGDDGPWADFKTSDLVSLALGGVPMNCGYDPEPGGRYELPPIAPQAWHSFHIAGEQLIIGVLAALLHRSRTGQGQQVSVSIHEAVAKNTELDVTNWIMLRQEIYRQTCRHASPAITNPSIAYTKDGRWLLSMSLGNKDLARLQPFMAKYGMDAGLAGGNPDDPAYTRPIGGSTASATSGTEIVQRLTSRFTYDNLPWREAQADGLLWTPIRKPHENATDEHWLARGTFADIEHPEIGRSLRYPVSKWLSTAGSWQDGERAPRLGQHTEKALRDGQAAPAERMRAGATAKGRPAALSALGLPFPLQGVRILDFTWFLASAGSTRFLAALGADVIKVEWKTHPDSGRGFTVPEGGRQARDKATGPLRSVSDPSVGGQFNNKNPGKRGLSLNVADPRGLEIAQALAAKCDIVAEGFSPGVLERWGLGYDVLRKIRSDMIYVKQSGMGAFGKYGRFKCLGPIAAALSGVAEMSGIPEPAPPAGWGYSYLDWFGAYSMALSILAALYHRDQTGEGQWIDASQTEVGIYLTGVPVLDWSANSRPWHRSGNRSPYRAAAPHGIYRCAGDDRWIALSCFSEREWAALARTAGRSQWTADPRFASLQSRIANQDALDAEVELWTRDQEPYAIMNALQAAGVPAGVCQTAADRYDHDPQLAHLDWLTELDSTRLGRWPVAALPVKMSVTPPYVGGLPNRGGPLYGEDNTAILTGLLGMSGEEIEKLSQEGVL
jgi:crotonobetainyl-CoA:carnitine CoA-transferase CaiB-like acyl-CoA transferase